MRIVFMLEEPSMKNLLDCILPRILPPDVSYVLIPHQGKTDLVKSLPIKLKAWNEPDAAFVVLHDQDSNDCIRLKQKLKEICAPYNRKVLIRIPCHEMEAWYWGDLEAVSQAYQKNLLPLQKKKQYREPDQIVSPKFELRRHIPELTQIDGARKIGPLMDLNRNTSHSFQVFVQGVRNLCKEG